MSATFAVVLAEFRRVARDRTAMFFMFALPFLIITVVGVSIPNDSSAVTIGVVRGDDDEIAGRIVDGLRREEGVTVRLLPDEAAVRRDTALRAVQVGLMLPPGLSSAVTDGRSTVIDMVTADDARAVIALRHVQSVVGSVSLRADAIRFVREQVGGSESQVAGAVDASLGSIERGAVSVTTVGEQRTVTGYDYLVPGQLALFLFVNSLAAGGIVVELRRTGVARRARAAPGGLRPVVAGVVGFYWMIAMLQAVVIMAIGGLVFEVAWGSPLVVVPAVGLHALVATAAAVLFGTVAATPEQATALGIPVGLAMAALGGCMFPLDLAPRWMAVAGHALTPHAWTLDALLAAGVEGAGVADTWRPLLVLATLCLLLVPFALFRLSRRLEAA